MEPEHQVQGVEIPHTQLPAETLAALIEAFILQEGTDYGAVESALGTKVQQVKRQLERGEAKILFNPEDESCTIYPVRR